MLTSHLSGRTAEVQAGQALQRVLLTATARGLAASFLSQAVEVARSRDELRRLVRGTRLPQAVLRIGAEREHHVHWTETYLGGHPSPRSPVDLSSTFAGRSQDVRDDR